jgi:DNA-binding PadR family transcriptional regulator
MRRRTDAQQGWADDGGRRHRYEDQGRRRRYEDEGWRHGGDEGWRRGGGGGEGWRHGGGGDEGRRPKGGGRRGHGGRGFPGRGEMVAGPGFGPGMHGPGLWFGEPRLRGPRARRGDVRAAALALLAEEPRNGYQIIQEIGERSGGVWRPSPGSVYPALQQLEDENLIRAEAGDGGRRAYVLTDAGRAYVADHPDEVRAPWDVVAGSAGGTALEMRRLIGQVAVAAFQVASVGTEDQVGQARKVLTEARKALYRILAADDDEGAGDQA